MRSALLYRGIIKDRDQLFVQTPESFGQRFNLEVRNLSEVLSIDRRKKEVLVKDIRNGSEYRESYDKLILSPGAEPIKPMLPGINQEGIFTLRNVPDTDKIKQYIEQKQARHALVVGAGFIGLEMAENLHHAGLKVTIVEMAEQVMTPLDYSMAALVHQHLKTKNVEFYLQTSDPDIYALGDAIEFENPVTHTNMISYLAGPANKQGRILADSHSTRSDKALSTNQQQRLSREQINRCAEIVPPISKHPVCRTISRTSLCRCTPVIF